MMPVSAVKRVCSFQNGLSRSFRTVDTWNGRSLSQ
jgi:hypothetical protein